ncbi:hypothetical protein KAU51_00530 [Candidatus Parcubacteria bacterium]|nr:hypothetical protein [Candidatus Parcubacteria bacterium]
MVLTNWVEITFEKLGELWLGVLDFIPALIGALVVFVIGWFIALAIGRVITEILIRVKFNELFERTDWKQALEKAKLTVNPAEFLGAIVKWILVIVFLMAAVEILNLPGFADFLSGVVAYLPNVFIAALIFVVAVIVADIVEKVVVAAVEKIRVGYSQFVGVIVKWAIWIFAILAILYQLGVVPEMIQTLFTGLIALIVISVGLAFGLGGKDVAAELLQDWKRRLRGE